MEILFCFGAVLVSVVSASYQPSPMYHYGPKHRGAYGGAGGHGGGIDPMTLLLLQNGGGLGQIPCTWWYLLLINRLLGGNKLLPLLLSGALGGKKGGMNPLLLTSLLGDGKCEEKYKSGCTQPTTANSIGDKMCGLGDSVLMCEDIEEDSYACCPCCTCPDTVEIGVCRVDGVIPGKGK